MATAALPFLLLFVPGGRRLTRGSLIDITLHLRPEIRDKRETPYCKLGVAFYFADSPVSQLTYLSSVSSQLHSRWLRHRTEAHAPRYDVRNQICELHSSR